MKRTWIPALMLALSLALLSGCASTESLEEKINSGDFTAGDVLNLAKNYAKEERAWDAHRLLHFGLDTFPDDAKLMAGLEKYPMPAPELLVTENADGSKSLTVENTYGFGEETVICVSDVPCENSEDVMETAHSKSPTYSHDSYTIGEETIYLCFAEELHGQTCLSEMSSVTITIEALNFSPFAFGEFDNGELAFDNTYGGEVYYTLDGTDPLVNGTLQGILYDPYDDTPLPAGEFTVSARCALPDGSTSDLIQDEILVEYNFCNASGLVSEDRYYEYVTTGNGPLYRSDKLGNGREIMDNRTIESVAALDFEVVPEEASLAFRVAQQTVYRARFLYLLVDGNLETQWEEDYIYADRVETGSDISSDVWASIHAINGDLLHMDHDDGHPFTWTPRGSTSTAGDMIVMQINSMRLWSEFSGGSSTVYEDKNVLFEVSGHEIVLDAFWYKDSESEARVLYHYSNDPTAHFVAKRDGTVWNSSPNPVTNGLNVLGYTENGVYYLDGGDICRKAMNYWNL